MSDACVHRVDQVHKTCLSKPCSSACCDLLRYPLSDRCAAWSHTHAIHLVQDTLRAYSADCHRACEARLTCLDDQEMCGFCSLNGTVNPTCSSHLKRLNIACRDKETVLECFGRQHVRPGHYDNIVLSKARIHPVSEADFDYIRWCGCTSRCLAHKRAACPRGFFSKLDDRTYLYTKSVGVASYVGAGSPNVSASNVVVTIAIPLLALMYYVLNALRNSPRSTRANSSGKP